MSQVLIRIDVRNPPPIAVDPKTGKLVTFVNGAWREVLTA